MPETIEVVDPSTPAPIPQDAPVAEPQVKPAVPLKLTHEVVEVEAEASTAASELGQLVGKQEGNAGLLMAVIAVAGGGAAWKFYSQRSKQAHELNVREMELKANQPTVSPPQCIAKHTDLEARISAAEAKAAQAVTTADEVRSKAGRVAPLIAQVEEIDERVTVIETATKRASAKVKKA
jgi:uncharacterized protein HemX